MPPTKRKKTNTKKAAEAKEAIPVDNMGMAGVPPILKIPLAVDTNTPPDFSEQKKFAKKMYGFAQSEYYGILLDKLTDDIRARLEKLVAQEDERVRGQIQYLEELIGWVRDGKRALEIYEYYEKAAQEDY